MQTVIEWINEQISTSKSIDESILATLCYTHGKKLPIQFIVRDVHETCILLAEQMYSGSKCFDGNGRLKIQLEILQCSWQPNFGRVNYSVLRSLVYWYMRSQRSEWHPSANQSHNAQMFVTLECRRFIDDLTLCYNILHGLCDISLSINLSNSVTRGSCLKLVKPTCSSDIRKYFFTSRVIDVWNCLNGGGLV